MERVVFDTWALLAFVFGEEEADAMENLLRKVEEGRIAAFYSAVNLAEFYRRICVETNEEDAREKCIWLRSTGLKSVNVDYEQAIFAGHIKNKYPRLSYGDAFAVAAVIDVNADHLVTGDPDFIQVDEVKIILPSGLCAK
ncbi:MAG: hypothetical protein DDT40_01398 [candidate division WS2 bacterium]|nr:hypothetical protein [Candidatus Psychracetigena formicireducens]